MVTNNSAAQSPKLTCHKKKHVRFSPLHIDISHAICCTIVHVAACTNSPAANANMKQFQCGASTLHSKGCSTSCEQGYSASGTLQAVCSFGKWGPVDGECLPDREWLCYLQLTLSNWQEVSAPNFNETVYSSKLSASTRMLRCSCQVWQVTQNARLAMYQCHTLFASQCTAENCHFLAVLQLTLCHTACSGDPVDSVAYGSFNCGIATQSGSNCTANCNWAAGPDGPSTANCTLGKWSNVTGSCTPPPQGQATYQTVSISMVVVVTGGCSEQKTIAIRTGLVQDISQALDGIQTGAVVDVEVDRSTVSMIS
jgi:hypothetical protein